MLKKRKKNLKKSENVLLFFQNIPRTSGHMAQGNQETRLKEIHAIGSEIIDYSDGRTDGRRTNFDFMISADITKQSQKWHCVVHVLASYRYYLHEKTPVLRLLIPKSTVMAY